MIFKMIVAVVITCIWHELGHVLAIVLFNLQCKRYWNDFTVSFTKSRIIVTHCLFSKASYNMIVALAGPVFPSILASFLVLSGYFANYAGFIFIISLVHMIFLCPIFTDGKNIRKYLD